MLTVKKLLKRIAAFGLVAGLSLSHTVIALAADISPGNYVFVMALRACGVSPGTNNRAVLWQSAFEGYLEDTGNQALLNQLKGYNGLSWGSTVEGVDSLYWAVREWVSSASVNVYSDSMVSYILSSSPAPQLNKITKSGEVTINKTPFSGPPALPDQGYTYLFSDAYYYGSDPSAPNAYYMARNVYAPSGVEVFGVVTGYGSESKVSVSFYTPDSSSSTGYRLIDLKSSSCGFRFSNGAYVTVNPTYSTWNWNTSLIRNVMNYPFRIFGTEAAASEYCKTGTVSDLVTGDSLALVAGGSASGTDPELINRQVDSVGSTMAIPDSAAAADTILSSLQQPMDVDSLSTALASAGMDVSYTAGYKVEHYKQDVSDLDKPVTWIKMSEETLTGVVGSAPSLKPKSYSNFLYAPELTEPQNSKILGDGSLVIRLYYKPDPDAEYPYTVEYHKEGEVFKTVSGSVPVFGDRMVRSCEDFCPQYYLPDSKASTPLPFEVSEYKNTIHIYYKRDVSATFPYTVEYYKDGELFKAVPGSVSVFSPSVKSCVSYCPSGYVLDTTASTPLPYNVPEDSGGVIKNYYVKKDTVISYTVEYYRDGIRKNTYSGNVPSSSPVVQSCPSYCPEYYKVDAERSDSFPYTLSEGTSRNRIRIYYIKDKDAVFPYTVECYKDGELVETTSKTISVFSPAVKEYGFDCPEGYVVDTSSSTSLPYSVSKDSNVIKYYYVDEGKTLPYTVEYHRDGKVQMTLTGNVPVTSPEVKQYWPYSPSGYLLDEEASDTLPFTVTRENNVIHAYYVPDPANPYASFVSGVKTMMNSVAAFLKGAVWWLIFLVLLVIFCDRNMVIFKRLTSHAWKKEPKQKKKVFTAPKSKFMKGVHANKGSSLRSKANMQKGIRPGSLKSKATISDRRWKGGYTRR